MCLETHLTTYGDLTSGPAGAWATRGALWTHTSCLTGVAQALSQWQGPEGP
jgi:hypothetical protein